MHLNRVKTLVAGMIVPLAMLIGTIPALAHGRGHPLVLIQGTVTAIDVSNGDMQVLTPGGTVSVGLTSSTIVIRMANGSTADLRPGQHVDAHRVRGSTIDIITIQPKSSMKPHDKSGNSAQRPLPARDEASAKGASSRGPGHHRGPSNHVAGIVMAVSDTTVTLKVKSGKSVVYAFSGSLTVIKIIKGSVTDLAVNEIVRITAHRDGTAAEITILKAY